MKKHPYPPAGRELDAFFDGERRQEFVKGTGGLYFEENELFPLGAELQGLISAP
ncbi:MULTISPECIES: hypothetical protein [Paenibacillus]|uniref:Uncharacterized protein n=1 Tax=Paenibacillus violae TaxID=3077234 RepID=A0ABU3R8W0_9BACL|nr:MULTISPECIES: hypothetical protein [Paenibacillus]MDU0200491.1 hypothetical protein [Paenibacillus sp. PFR10]MEC0264613.1 hypothetical protein [Paenibacillus anseongense]